MKKSRDIKTKILTPLSGFGVLLSSIAVFVLVLYILTILMRLIFIF